MNREEWLLGAVEELRPVFEAEGFPLPDKIRVACGFPAHAARSAAKRRIGEYWSPASSADGSAEILISPVLAEAGEVFATLVHELCHAATPGDGHGKKFRAAARALLLEGKPTATVGGAAFFEQFQALIDGLGEYPHAVLSVGADRKKQSTRMLKACCPECGYTVRLSAKWAAVGLPSCPVDGETFNLENKGESDDE